MMLVVLVVVFYCVFSVEILCLSWFGVLMMYFDLLLLFEVYSLMLVVVMFFVMVFVSGRVLILMLFVVVL